MPATRPGARQTRVHKRGSPDSDSLVSDTLTASSESSPRRSSRFISRNRDASPTGSLSSLTSLDTSPEPDDKEELQPIIIRGQTLHPTVVFDTLFYWLNERKAIDNRRRAGMPAPWTEDSILQKYKFCNAYRVLDRTSQFVVTDVIEKGSKDRTELLFRILLFNAFNRIETWELLQDACGGTPTWDAFDLHEYDKVLSGALDVGVSLFSGAYIKIGYKLDYDKNHMHHLQLLEILMEELPDVLVKAQYAADVYERIAAHQGMGAFSAYQLMLSLSYSPLLNFAANDFVVPGLGASSGLVKLFGASMQHAKAAVPDIEADVLRWLTSTQRAHFTRLGIAFPYLNGGHELDVADFEHAVCEVDKYARKKHPRVRGIGDRKELRGVFRPTKGALPVPVLPHAWADPARSVSRVRAEPLVVEKKWCLVKVLGERRTPAGAVHEDELEYQVSWFGYLEPTWEPRYSIVHDAPKLVAEYEATLKTTIEKSRKTKRTKKARR
ncbi:hypothetical protein C8R46DRAFT_1105576 [Mycena filopes]|nr:hypothetical protein C8R46DRAFT_1105576 [Mycena filopes]